MLIKMIQTHTGRPGFDQLGTIKLYGPVYDQSGVKLSLLWRQSMINMFLYGRDTVEVLWLITTDQQQGWLKNVQKCLYTFETF